MSFVAFVFTCNTNCSIENVSLFMFLYNKIKLILDFNNFRECETVPAVERPKLNWARSSKENLIEMLLSFAW